MKTQIVIYTAHIWNIGGIETFVYNFCDSIKDKYDITVLYDDIDPYQLARLMKIVRTYDNNNSYEIECDTLIINSIFDYPPKNVKYNKLIRMVHSCKMDDNWKIPQDYDIIIPVSQVVYDSFKSEIDDNKCTIIHNVTLPKEPKRVLRLVSATRMTKEKGEDRIVKLANTLIRNDIPFIWTVFTKKPLKKMPYGMVFVEPTLDIKDYIADSDFLVQLSDSEAFCYSIVESLELGTPCIVTDLPVLKEIGFENGKHGIVVNFDMNNINVDDIYNKEYKFEYHNTNKEIINQWKNLLGKESISSYEYGESGTLIKALTDYNDLQLNREVKENEILLVSIDRANQIYESGLCDIL